MSSNPLALGKNIVRARHLIGDMSGAQTARNAGIAVGKLHAIEDGKVLPTRDELLAIARVVGKMPARLINNSGMTLKDLEYTTSLEDLTNIPDELTDMPAPKPSGLAAVVKELKQQDEPPKAAPEPQIISEFEKPKLLQQTIQLRGECVTAELHNGKWRIKEFVCPREREQIERLRDELNELMEVWKA